jgi:hypothetical protein
VPSFSAAGRKMLIGNAMLVRSITRVSLPLVVLFSARSSMRVFYVDDDEIILFGAERRT